MQIPELRYILFLDNNKKRNILTGNGKDNCQKVIETWTLDWNVRLEMKEQ